MKPWNTICPPNFQIWLFLPQKWNWVYIYMMAGTEFISFWCQEVSVFPLISIANCISFDVRSWVCFLLMSGAEIFSFDVKSWQFCFLWCQELSVFPCDFKSWLNLLWYQELIEFPLMSGAECASLWHQTSLPRRCIGISPHTYKLELWVFSVFLISSRLCFLSQIAACAFTCT